jgi:hypothetical protein
VPAKTLPHIQKLQSFESNLINDMHGQTTSNPQTAEVITKRFQIITKFGAIWCDYVPRHSRHLQDSIVHFGTDVMHLSFEKKKGPSNEETQYLFLLSRATLVKASSIGINGKNNGRFSPFKYLTTGCREK